MFLFAPIYGVFTVLTFEKKEKGDRCSAQDVVVVVQLFHYQENGFSFPFFFTTSRFPFDFFFLFLLLHSHSLCTCSRGLVEGMLLKSMEKAEKVSSPPFSSSSKAIKVVCVSTTRRLANTPILQQQQLDCSCSPSLLTERKNFLFLFFKQDELHTYYFIFWGGSTLYFIQEGEQVRVPFRIIDQGIWNFLWSVIEIAAVVKCCTHT